MYDPSIPYMALIREPSSDVQTRGRLLVLQNSRILVSAATIEREWANNAKGISCILPGIYPIDQYFSPRFKETLWRINRVPGRSGILIHVANFHFQLEGCVGPGDMHIDINKDGHPDVRSSRATLDRIHEAMQGVKKSIIIVVGTDGISQFGSYI